MAKTVGVYVFENVEALDFAGPYEVFTCASRVYCRDSGENTPPFHVFTIGCNGMPVSARAGLRILPDHDISNHPRVDILIIPGGVVEAELSKSGVIDWIARTAQESTLVASVCTGAFLLAQAGLLGGKQVTTHWEDQHELQLRFPELRVLADRRWVDEGKIVTSGGISAGIDMSLHLVERCVNRTLAQRVARQMEFDWTENS